MKTNFRSEVKFEGYWGLGTNDNDNKFPNRIGDQAEKGPTFLE